MRRYVLAVGAASILGLAACDFGGDAPETLADVASISEGLAPEAFEGALEAVGPDGAWRLSIAPEAGIALSERDAGVDTRAAYTQPVGVDQAVEIGSAPLTVRITRGPCSNGMAGVNYDFTVQVTREGAPPLSGCLYRPWASQIVALEPQVSACLGVSPDSALSYLRGNDDGGAFMRVRGSTGAETDCTMVGGGTAPQTMPANPSQRYPGEMDVLFYPAPGEQPGGECYAAPEVRDASGRVLGWLADPNGC
ncbi:MAG: hypothetical protein KGS44_04215 [Alphaproteobacteria bacterium]|jgi:hypothetical protein|nr:hypothetical protein [Alphaproteobacteria bacterium]